MDNMGQHHDGILEAQKTKQRTYDALADEQSRQPILITLQEPEEAVKALGLEPQEHLDPTEYPLGTIFYHVNGKAYVRRTDA